MACGTWLARAFSASDELGADCYEMCSNTLSSWVRVGDETIGKAKGTIEALKGVRAAEAALEAKVKGGLQVPDFARAILDSDRTVELP